MKSVDEILIENGLDFHIEKQPLVGKDENGGDLITPYYGLFNTQTGECINTCKKGYTVSQNRDVIERVLRGIEHYSNDLTVSKAGSIHGGRRVYVQLEINGKDAIGGTDKITRYVTVIDSNDGSTGLSVGIGDMVMHCQNQFFKFYKSGTSKFRHTATIEQKIQELPMLIELGLGKSLKQLEIYNRFMSTPLSKLLANRMVKEVMGYDRLITPQDKWEELGKRTVDMVDTLHANIRTECDIVGDNLWGLFNGLTRYTTHEQKVPKRNNGKDESLLVGTAYKKAIVGYEYLLNYAKSNKIISPAEALELV